MLSMKMNPPTKISPLAVLTGFAFILCALTAAHASGTTSETDGIETGVYLPVPSLASGEHHMCDKEAVTVSVFTIPSPQDKRKAVRLSGRFSYFVPLQEGVSKITSDIDSNCVFVEKSTREGGPGKFTVSKTDSEICNGTTKSADVTTMTITPGRITLEITDKNGVGPGYTCVYDKKAKH